jgi:peptidyl-prolyl cis-trans isomerase B (cyclophilin B)
MNSYVTDFSRCGSLCPNMKPLVLSTFAAVSALCLSATLHAQEPASSPDEVALIETSKGPIVVEFWPDVAPGTVENFKKLARQGFFDGTAFHRIIKGFMAQGGDPLTKDPANEPMYGTGDPGYKIKAEFNDRPHERGVLSMARSANPDSAGSQFFLMFDRAPHLDNQYTGFGKMIAGEETLAAIESVPVGMSRQGEPSKPLERVEVQKVTIMPRADWQTKAGQ